MIRGRTEALEHELQRERGEKAELEKPHGLPRVAPTAPNVELDSYLSSHKESDLSTE